MDREPAVAGKFYASNAKKLEQQIDGFVQDAKVDKKKAADAISYVAPHAGYEYSGHVEGFTYKALSMKKDLDEIDTFVIVGPNHTGFGYPVSISALDWKTPLGIVRNDVELAKDMAAQSAKLTMDDDGHRLEHSVEVQLPFLQRIVKNPRCCFICMGDQSLEYCNTVTSAITKAAKSLGRSITVIASSDFNHYESAQVAEGKDMPAIRELEKLNTGRFHMAIEKLDDSACGYGPITVSAMFAKERGAKSGILLKYANSGDITKDYDSVVAYSSMIFA